MRFWFLGVIAAWWCGCWLGIPTTLLAQRVQFPGPAANPPTILPFNPNGPPAWGGAGAGLPSLGGTIQPFDPYAIPGGGGTQPAWPGSVPGPMPPPAGYGGAPIPGSVNPWGGNPSWGRVPADIPPMLPPVAGPPYGTPIGGSGAGSGGGLNPPSPLGGGIGGLGPRNGLGPNPFDGASTGGGPYGGGTGYPPYQRLFQDTGLRATYIYGKEGDDMALTEVEASTTAYLANFLGVPNGLRLTPGFVFHWTDGPQFPEIQSDVPARLYSAYLEAGLQPQFGPRFGAEINARVGVYSDFQTFTSHSIRTLGSAVGVFQLNERTALKLGGAYIDRNKIKFLPAAGILWEPNPQTRWDIFFPAPKIANYWTTVGNRQVWWYLGGEYGGGAWTIKREELPLFATSERIDINDIRAYVGVEWWNLNRYYAFLELGFVFNREIVYVVVPSDSIKVDDSLMVRGGFSW